MKVAETVCSCDMDCENEKEDAVEKDEMNDIFFHFTFVKTNLFLTEEVFIPREFVVNFTSDNYRNLIYCPPESFC